MHRTTPTEIEELRALVGTAGGQAAGFLIEHKIPAAHLDPFWIFTGPQGCYQDETGARLIPATAWFEYLAWLGDSGDDPRKVTPDTKYQWRQRTSRGA